MAQSVHRINTTKHGTTTTGAIYYPARPQPRDGEDDWNWPDPLDSAVDMLDSAANYIQDSLDNVVETWVCGDSQTEGQSETVRSEPAEARLIAEETNTVVNGNHASQPRMPSRCFDGCFAATVSCTFWRRFMARSKTTELQSTTTSPTSPVFAPKSTVLSRDRSFFSTTESSSIAEILNADDQGRVLEACQLLDGLDSNEQCCEADGIRTRAQAVRDALGIFARAKAAAAEGGSDWQDCSKDARTRLWFRYDWYTGALEVIGDIVLDIPAIQLWCMLREVDLLPLWSRALESILLRAFSSSREMYYIKTQAAAYVLSPTELYSERSFVDALDQHGLMMVMGQSPSLEASSHLGVEIPLARSGVKRIAIIARDACRPLSPSSTSFMVYRSVQTGLPYLPGWVIGMAAGVIIEGQIKGVKGLLESWPGSAHESRMKEGDRADAYASLQKRLEKMVDCRDAVAP